VNPKTTLRDYGLILLALAGIFASGYAIGNRRSDHPPPPAASLDDSHWQNAAFSMLNRELQLTPDQQEPVRKALSETNTRLLQARDETLRKSHGILIDLIDQISPELTPEQRKILDNDRLRLQKNLIQKEQSADGLFPFRKKEKPTPSP
jgi:hypothetical protein